MLAGLAIRWCLSAAAARRVSGRFYGDCADDSRRSCQARFTRHQLSPPPPRLPRLPHIDIHSRHDPGQQKRGLLLYCNRRPPLEHFAPRSPPNPCSLSSILSIQRIRVFTYRGRSSPKPFHTSQVVSTKLDELGNTASVTLRRMTAHHHSFTTAVSAQWEQVLVGR